jgi:signal transduction histidine kinase
VTKGEGESGVPPGGGVSEEATRLIFAVCHEIGNMVAAVRLQAHLLDDDLVPKQLAKTSVEIDDLSARMSAMLALVRPLMSQPRSEPTGVQPLTIFAAVQQALDDYGGRGMTLDVICESDLPGIVTDPDVMHHLLLTLVFGAVETAQHKGTVTVKASLSNGGVVFAVEDDAEEDTQLMDWREHMLRGRPLTCAVADFILRKHNGSLAVCREDGVTRVSLCFGETGAAKS